jgi:formate-dependent nitrite reductase cytochrome c552 subunit
VACHQKSSDNTLALFTPSIHARAGFTCDSCHGGDAQAPDRAAAHAVNFTGNPSPVEQLRMCGACHQQALADFKTSSHFPKNLNVPRLSCSDCHGAHTVGSPARDFSFAMFCTNCHGLEYLPELPAAFRNLLQIADEENRLLARFSAWGRKPANELLAKRKAIRGIIGELVHKTDMAHGLERAPEINQLNETFKRMSEAPTK